MTAMKMFEVEVDEHVAEWITQLRERYATTSLPVKFKEATGYIHISPPPHRLL